MNNNPELNGGVSMRTSGDKNLIDSLNRIESPELRKQLMDRLATYGHSSTVERFDTQTAPDGNKWKESHRAKEAGGLTLVKTPRLAVSFSTASTATSAAWGTNLPYAKTHQFGAIITPKNKKALAFRINGKLIIVKSVTIPARPMLGVNEYDKTRFAGITNTWMKGNIA